MKRRGFTLLELMVVISIIALLAAILFPIFARSREAARRSGCASNLSQIGVALNMYAQNFNGHFPEEDNEFAPIDSYARNDDIFWCPSDADKQPWKYTQEPKPAPSPTPAPGPELGPAPTVDVPAPGAPPPPAPTSPPGKPGDKDWQKTPPAVKEAPGVPGASAQSPAPAPAPSPLPVPSPFGDEDDSKVPLKTFSSYAYKGGLMNDDRADTPIASEAKPWHRDLVNVLYLGGHVKGHPAKGYKPVVTPRKNPPPPPEQRSGGGG